VNELRLFIYMKCPAFDIFEIYCLDKKTRARVCVYIFVIDINILVLART